MQIDLGGRAYVVGGASRGIGYATAAELVSAGARVLLLSRSEDAVTSAARELGESAFALAADMGAPDTAGRVRAAVGEHFGGRLDRGGGKAGGPAPRKAPHV